ncbi:MAG TPA: diguanylate cyclase [Noviherbaspirillum sp.]|jgi:diguanylate cyclase (GGDEF)-like protein|uniref:GGDEF domain-containing protein n=1 Tax=Noviherbaspirillum sp. TaxID=1926288 RepID=UPI002F91ED56
MVDNHLAVQDRGTPECIVQAPVGAVAAARPDRLIYLLRHDLLYAMDAAMQLQSMGYEIGIADSLDELLLMMAERLPVCVIVDSPDRGVTLTPGDAACVRAASGGTVPLLLLSASHNFEARLAAARARVDGYLNKPLDMGRLAERLDALATMSRSVQKFRVLVVCSSAGQAAYYDGVVAVAGMDTIRSRRPGDILRLLDQFRPDAVLIDVDNGECSAGDLTALVRQDSAFVDIPVIMLSSEDSPEARQNAIRSGADEYVTKPVPAAELIVLLSSRMERYRTLRGLIMRDRLTGLYNHVAFKEQLEREIARARREDRPLAFAMVDLDHFKKINDLYGHPAGDQVIRSIARLMRSRLRHGDVVGRYGGEEFAVILPATTAGAAAEVLNEIRAEFQGISHRAGDASFTASFSGGVVESGPASSVSDVMSMIAAADNALYRSKRMGRNRIEIAAG